MKPSVSQRSMMRVAIALTWLPVIAMAQGWRDQCGYLEWEMLTGQSAATLGAGVEASMVEARVQEYEGQTDGPFLPQGTAGILPFAGNGNYSGKTFTPKSGAAGTSWHAVDVGNHYFGNAAGGAAGTAAVSCWEANDYIALLQTIQAGSGSVTAKTQSNAWIYDPTSNQSNWAGIVARSDYLTNQNNMLTAVGLNNGSGTIVPMLLSSSYNAISCGVSSGEHSRGGTTASGGLVAGRLKPEIVTPESATSWSTGAIAGMATALLSRADDGNLGTSATDARVLRAILYTGATKHEFPGWSRGETQPIDTVYGAGEANLFHSWRILTAGAQSNVGTVAARGWSCPTLSPNTSQSYSFVLPSTGVPNSLVATAVWNRTVAMGTYSYRPLQVITLEVYDSSNVLLQRSASTIDNLQHIYLRNLPQGQTLRVQVSSDVNNTLSATIVGLAWRADPMVNATTSVASSMGAVGQLQFNGLINGCTCRVERSADLVNWSGVHDFTTTGTSASWNDPSPPAAPVFYRLRYFTP